MSVFRRHEDQTEGSPGRRSRRRDPALAPDGTETAGLPVDRGADAQEQFIIDALHDLRDTVVREVMTPRVDVVALSIPLTVESVSKAVRSSGHSCFPVCGEDLDDLIGVLFVNDLFRAGWTVAGGEEGGSSPTRSTSRDGCASRSSSPSPAWSSTSWPRCAASAGPSPWSWTSTAAWRASSRSRTCWGRWWATCPTSSTPTRSPTWCGSTGGAGWSTVGPASTTSPTMLGIDLPEGEYVTLGGYLFDAFGHIPEEGETHDLGHWQLRVSEMDKRRIAKVVVKRTDDGSVGTGGSAPDGRGTDHTAVG